MEKIKTPPNAVPTRSDRQAESTSKNSTQETIVLQLNRLAAHFPKHGTDEDWDVLINDYVAGLEEYPIEKIELAVWNHIRKGEFFPKLSELVARCKPKFETAPPHQPNKELEFCRPDDDTRRRQVTEWEKQREKIHREQLVGKVPEFALMTESEAAAKLPEIGRRTLDGATLRARQARVDELLKTRFMKSAG